VFTVLPPLVLRYRAMRADAVNTALFARPGGLRLERCAVSCHISPMAISRLVCARGQQRFITVRTRWGLPLPASVLADEKPSHGLADHVSLPTSVRGRVLWPLGDTEEARAAALTPSDGAFHCAASHPEPSDRVRGLRTAGFESPLKSLRPRFPAAPLGHGRRQAVHKLPGQRTAVASSVRQAGRSRWPRLLHRGRPRNGGRVLALGQHLRHVADYVVHTAGAVNGERVRHWIRAKKAGWEAVLNDPRRPVTSTRLDQAPKTIDRQLCMMTGFHHPQGSPPYCLNGLALLDDLGPDQRHAQHVGPWDVEVDGGTVPPRDWWLNRHIPTTKFSRMRKLSITNLVRCFNAGIQICSWRKSSWRPDPQLFDGLVAPRSVCSHTGTRPNV
jgi:hypothetical protein